MTRERGMHRLLRYATVVLACMLAVGCSQRGPAGAPAAGSVAGAGTPEGVATASDGRARGQQSGAVDWPAMQRFWTAAMALKGVDTGPVDSKKRMLMFFDPNCPVCAEQWSIVKPYLQTVRIHWIPVAVIHPDSLRRAAAILAAPDPGAALAFNEEHYDFTTEHGGYLPPASVPAWALAAVQANTRARVFTRPIEGTPTWGWELYPGKRYFRQYGAVNARGMWLVVQELGDTMDPYARAAELMQQAPPAAASQQGSRR